MPSPKAKREDATRGAAGIDWSKVEDAYGPATDLPKDLQALRSPTPRTRRTALERLWARLCHQGSVYEASAVAVPFLVEVAGNARLRDRDRVLELLGGIAVGDHANFLDGSLSAKRRPKRRPSAPPSKSVEQRCHDAVAARAPAVRVLLGDRDARVRGAAAFVLAWLNGGEKASATAIAARCRDERDPAARASMLIALGHLGATSARPELTRALTFAFDERKAVSLPRVAAAIALVYLDGRRAPDVARALLDTASAVAPLAKTLQPWNGGDLAGHAAAVAATFPARKADLGSKLARLSVVGYIAGDLLAGQLVRSVFKGRGAKRAASLTHPERALLEAIVTAGLLRPMGQVEQALAMRGLPELRELPCFVGVNPGVHRELRRRR